MNELNLASITQEKLQEMSEKQKAMMKELFGCDPAKTKCVGFSLIFSDGDIYGADSVYVDGFDPKEFEQ